jgi:hypothetical protein
MDTMELIEPGQRIQLRVMMSYLPGSTWWSQVDATSTPNGTVVTHSGGDWQDPVGQINYVTKKDDRDCFRALVSALTSDQAQGGIPADALVYVDVRGVDGWKADFAEFCWVRDEQFSAQYARDFVGFDDWHLAQLYAQARQLSDLYRPREKALSATFHATWHELREDRDQLEQLREKTFAQIVDYLSLGGREDFWNAMIDSVHRMAETARSRRRSAEESRAEELAPIREFAKRAHYPDAGGGSTIGNALRFNGLVEYIESYFKQTGRYPAGRHIVPYKSSLSSGGRSPATSKMEVLFPNYPDCP